jgi:hypothetical protein
MKLLSSRGTSSSGRITKSDACRNWRNTCTSPTDCCRPVGNMALVRQVPTRPSGKLSRFLPAGVSVISSPVIAMLCYTRLCLPSSLSVACTYWTLWWFLDLKSGHQTDRCHGASARLCSEAVIIFLLFSRQQVVDQSNSKVVMGPRGAHELYIHRKWKRLSYIRQR